MSDLHPFHELVQKETKSDLEKIVIALVIVASTHPRYSDKTFEEIWDAMLKDWEQGLYW